MLHLDLASMDVNALPRAVKEAIKLHAESVLTQALELLTVNSWEHLTRSGNVKPFKGDDMKDIYEVRVSGYRAAFLVRCGNKIYIFAFLKKEGDHLKRSELNTIKERAKEIKNIWS